MTIGSVVLRARGTAAVVRQIRGQRAVHYLSRERLLARRDERVRELLRHAAASVPHYRELFRDEGVDPREVRGADELEQLPLLDKAHVQEEPARFRAESERGRNGLELRGTGTTGTPLRVFHDRGSLLANIAYGERERAVERVFIGASYRYRVLDLRGRRANFGLVQDFYATALFRPLRPKRKLVPVDVPPEEVVDTIERMRPAVVRGHASHLELIFRAALARGGLSHRPAVVVYAGDTMSAGPRRLIEDELGVPVLSVYGAVECLKIGFTCERRSAFHLHEDLAHVALLDPDGNRVGRGERGEVTLTNLVNRGTVLINYRLGDFARFSDETCPCGRTSRRLVELEGRVEEVVELADGTAVHPTDLRSPFRLRDGIVRFQLVQRERDRFQLRVVTRETPDSESALTEAVSELAHVLHGARIEIERAPELLTAPGEKFRSIVPLGDDTRGGNLP